MNWCWDLHGHPSTVNPSYAFSTSRNSGFVVSSVTDKQTNKKGLGSRSPIQGNMRRPCQMSSCTINKHLFRLELNSGSGSRSPIQGNMRRPCQMRSCTINKHLFRLLRTQFWFGFAFFNPREHEKPVSDEFVYHKQTPVLIVAGSILVWVRVLFLSFFLYFRRPNLITGPSGWQAPD